MDREFVDRLHALSLEHYGGMPGTRDEGMLESALARPYQTFAGVDLYPTPIEKAAAIAESIILNHPYLDGNKRTGFLAMLAVLDENNLTLKATEAEAYGTMIQLSTGALNYEGLVQWLQEHVHEVKI